MGNQGDWISHRLLQAFFEQIQSKGLILLDLRLMRLRKQGRLFTVPTGIPLGICAIDKRLSRPLSFLLSTGTPITGIVVNEAIIPGK